MDSHQLQAMINADILCVIDEVYTLADILLGHTVVVLVQYDKAVLHHSCRLA